MPADRTARPDRLLASIRLHLYFRTSQVQRRRIVRFFNTEYPGQVRLWLAHLVRCASVTGNNGQLTAVEERQEDCFLCGGWSNNGSAYYATLQPDPENNVVMVFDYSTDAVYPSMVYTSRRVTYGDSLMDGAGIFLCRAGIGVSGRWGDYTATSPDFSSSTVGLLWFAAQYAPTSGVGDGDRFSRI